jgi:hypothetical protein
MRQSALGERLTMLIFGPSGRQERLNCWLKNLQKNFLSHFRISASTYAPLNARFAKKYIFLGAPPCGGNYTEEIVQLVRPDEVFGLLLMFPSDPQAFSSGLMACLSRPDISFAERRPSRLLIEYVFRSPSVPDAEERFGTEEFTAYMDKMVPL